MRLIDADALLDAISVHLERIEQEIDDAPTIDHAATIEKPVYLDTKEVTKMVIEKLAAGTVKHGRWEPLYDNVWECSECEQTEQFAENIESTSRYCPNCGARMDGGTEDVDR